MNHRFRAPRAPLFCLLLAGMTSAFASPPVSIEFEAPFANDGQPLLDESGWEVLIELTMREDEYIGFFVEPDFPTNSDDGWLVFDDPDECFSHWSQEPPPDCFFELYGGDREAIPDDETYIEFHTGINKAGAEPNSFTKPDLTALLTDSAGAGPPFFEQFTGDEPLPIIVPTGPYTGADVEDGYGFGTDDLIPGLVLLSNAGPGIAYSVDIGTGLSAFEKPVPLVLRNLAGFVTAVSYELSDYKRFKGKGKKSGEEIFVTKIMLSMLVPPNLVRNILAIDNCVGEPAGDAGNCNGAPQYRVDGSEDVQTGSIGQSARQLSAAVMAETDFTLSAYLVSGRAKALLVDLDGDGHVDIEDAKLDPDVKVLSKEVSVTVSQFETFECGDSGANFFLSDLDSNGKVTAEECP